VRVHVSSVASTVLISICTATACSACGLVSVALVQ
jgi:hypothetical protein